MLEEWRFYLQRIEYGQAAERYNDQDEPGEKSERIARQIEPIEAVNGRSGREAASLTLMEKPS